MTNCAGLTEAATTFHCHFDIKLLSHLNKFKWLLNNHTCHFATEKNESGVVSDMSVSQEQRIDRFPLPTFDIEGRVQQRHLPLEGRGCLDENQPVGCAIVYPDTGRVELSTGASRLPAALLLAAEMRQPAILGNPEDNYLESSSTADRTDRRIVATFQ